MKYIELKGQRGTAGSDSIPGRIKDLGEHTIGLLIREDIQNKLDVHLDTNKPVELIYKLAEMQESCIKRIIKNIGEDYFENYFKKSYNNTKFPDAKQLMQNGIKLLNRKKKWFSLEIIENNCKGLIGDEKPLDENKKSNFSALMRIINSSEKDKSIQGGTWGKGSSVYTFISGLWFFFSYSVLSKPEGKVKKRFMGRGVFSPFYDKEKDFKYSGQSFYCRLEKDKRPSDALPFTDDADNQADLFDMEARDEKQYGTSILIPGFCPVIEDYSIEAMSNEFKNEILKNWFIPIYYNKLVCNVIGGKETIRIDKNFLRNIPELQYKLELLDWYDRGYPEQDGFKLEKISIEIPPLSKGFQVENLNEFAWKTQTASMDLAVRILNPTEFKDFKNSWETLDTIALTRNNGMIVTYYQGEALSQLVNNQVKTESILFGGVLAKKDSNQSAKEHLDLFLSYAENPAHNTWCSTKEEIFNCHLERFNLKNPTNRIKQIKNKILEGFKKIFIKVDPIPPNKDICKMFKILGGLKSKGDNVNKKAKYQAEIIEKYYDKDFRFVVKMKLVSQHNEDLELSFTPALDTLEGEEKPRAETLKALNIPEFGVLQLLDENFLMIEEGSSPQVSLTPNQSLTINIRTCAIRAKSDFKNVFPLIKISEKTIEHEYQNN